MTGLDPTILAEIAEQPVAAALHRVDGRWQLRMSRTLAHPAERVWAMLTDPAQLVRWSPLVPDRVLDRVGPACSRESPDDAEVAVDVLVCDPPAELVHRWGAHLLRWTLEPTAEGTRLTLQQTFDDRAEASSYGAGWHLCLAVLSVLDRGADPERVVAGRAVDYGWPGLRDRYAQVLGAGLTLTERPSMTTELVIGRPPAEVFEAFVERDLTTRIWFSGSTGRLEPGATVEWTWDACPDTPARVVVTAFEPPARLAIDWGGPDESPTHVEWSFQPAGDHATRVVITETGYEGSTGDAVVARVVDSMGGFTKVLVAMKALLEHGIALDLMAPT